MNEPTLAPLSEIKPNRFQPRFAEDPEAVAEIAASIARNGLMQVPTARVMPDGSGFELAFGHTRYAAFQLLSGQGQADYDRMPLIVRELDDLQMFEMAVAENLKRRDLNPVEQARAMKTYMDTFGKTSEQVGEFFGVSAETVRGSVRLLNLPETVLEKVGAGEIAVGAARVLLALQKVAPSEMDTALHRLAENAQHSYHQAPEVIVCGVLLNSKATKALEYESTFKAVSPKKFPHKHLKPVTPGQAIQLLGVKGKISSAVMQKVLEQLSLGVQQAEEYRWLSGDELERLTVLVSPPQCTQCPLMATVNHTDFCGMPMCWERKCRAWQAGLVEHASKELGIAVYDPEKDGDQKVVLYSFEDADKKLVDGKHPDVRLIPRGTHYNGFSTDYALVVVGKTAARRLAKKDDDREAQDNDVAERRRQERSWRRRELNAEAAQLFLLEKGSEAFGRLFDGISSLALLEEMVNIVASGEYHTEGDDEYQKLGKARRLGRVRCLLAGYLLYANFEIRRGEPLEGGPLAVAKLAQDLACAWGLKLPADWLEQAKGYEPKEEE